MVREFDECLVDRFLRVWEKRREEAREEEDRCFFDGVVHALQLVRSLHGLPAHPDDPDDPEILCPFCSVPLAGAEGVYLEVTGEGIFSQNCHVDCCPVFPAAYFEPSGSGRACGRPRASHVACEK